MDLDRQQGIAEIGEFRADEEQYATNDVEWQSPNARKWQGKHCK